MDAARRVSSGPVASTAGPAVALALVFLFGLAILGPPAHGHRGLIANRWVRDRRVEYDFTRSIAKMPANSIERIKRGAGDWNKLGGSVRLIAGSKVANYSPTTCPSRYQKNAMHYLPIDGPSRTLGVANVCFDPNTRELYSMQITFDTAESWFTGTGPPPSGQVDLWSVASHEFGHTLGIAHFTSGDPDCAVAELETMCPFYSPSMRVPDDHDKHGFHAIY